MLEKLYNDEFFEKYLKFDDNFQSFINQNSKAGWKEKLRNLKVFRQKKPIPNPVISLFYDKPAQFFGDYNNLLENTTYFDETGNSIFSHYFYIFYEKYKGKSPTNYKLYETHFNSFFKGNEKYLLLQNFSLDTPLLQLAKLGDQGFFIEMYQKLQHLGLINNELLLCSNINDETIVTYIINEIKYKSLKINNYDFYYNFIKNNKGIYEYLSNEDKQIVKQFLSKVIFDVKEYKEENFDEIYNNIKGFINNNKNENFFESIYTPEINYINCLFEICANKNDFDKLFEIVSLLSNKKEYSNKKCISNLCLVDHISYTLTKMNNYKRKGESQMNYAKKLINEIFTKIIKNLNEAKIKKYFSNNQRFEKGLMASFQYNKSLDFDKKCEFIELFSKITNGLSDSYISKELINLYYFLKLMPKNGDYNMNKLYDKNLYIKDFIKENAFLRRLINFAIKPIQKNIIDESKCKDSLMNFIGQKHFHFFKQNLPKNKVEQIILALINFELYYPNKSNEEKINIKYSDSIIREYILLDENLFNEKLDLLLSTETYEDFKEFLDILLSGNYNKSDTIYNKWFKKIMELTSKYFYVNYRDRRLPYVLSNHFHFLKGKPYEAEYNALFILMTYIANSIEFLLSDNYKRVYIYTDFYYTIKLKLIKNWDSNFDYSEIIKFIDINILGICKIFTGKKKMFVGIMKELAPNLNIELYSHVIEIVDKNLDKIQSYIKGRTPEKQINDFIFAMILLFMKKKYEKDNPLLIVFLLVHFYEFEDTEILKIVQLFENAFNTNNFKNILDNFVFMEFSYNNIYKVTDYIKINNKSLVKSFHILRYLNSINNFIYKKIRKGIAYYNYKGYIGHSFIQFTTYTYEDKPKYSNYFLYHLGLKPINNGITIDDYGTKMGGVESSIKQEIFNKYLKLFFSFMDESPSALNNNIFKQIISIIECTLKELKKNENNLNGYFWLPFINNNIILNLYEFLLFLKNEKNNIIEILYNFKPTQLWMKPYLCSILKYVKLKKASTIENKKKEFIRNEIFEILKKDKEYYYTHIALGEESTSIEYTNSFINKIAKLKDYDSILKEYENFIYYINSYEINKDHENLTLMDFYKFSEQCILVLVTLLEKNKKIFLDFFSAYMNKYMSASTNKTFKFDILEINIALMDKCLEKYLDCFPDIISQYNNDLDVPGKLNERIIQKKIEKYLVKYLFKKKNYDLFNHSNIKNHSSILNNLDSCLSILNTISDSKDCKFVLNKIQKTFCNDEQKLFIELLDRRITNKNVFDTLFNNISIKKDSHFYNTNKNKFIKSLYLYSQINGYYFIDKLLKYMSNFISLDNIKSFIYPQESEDTINEFLDDENLTNLGIDVESGIQKDKYLFFYALSAGKMNPNYETIALLMNYCPQEKAILDMFPFIYYLYKFSDFQTMSYISFFLNSKNKDTIKSLNKFLYNFSLFLEALYKQNQYIDSLSVMEKIILKYYIQINILDITPLKLFQILIKNDENKDLIKIKDDELNKIRDTLNEKIKEKKKCTELEFCIILALYEIKGVTLVPIKKYLPEFFSTIENYSKQFKNLKMPQICLKQSYDVKYNEVLINNIKNNGIKIFYYYSDYYYDVITIIIKEYGNILQNEENYFYYEQTVYNLVNNDKISPFNNSNSEIEEYYKGIEIIPESNNEDKVRNLDSLAAKCIFSLKDFTRSSSILIKLCFDQLDNDINNDKDYKDKIFKRYIDYLQIISYMCGIMATNSQNPFGKNEKEKMNINVNKYDIFILKDLLFQNDSKKLMGLRNSIDINQIKYYIVEGLKKHKFNQLQFFNVIINWIDCYLKQKSISKILTDTSNMTFTKYINHLNIYCSILVEWLFKIKDIMYVNDNENIKKCNITLIEDSNKDNARKNFGQSLYNLGNEIINHAKNNGNFENEFKPTITFYYHFDENIGDYVETTSGNELIFFIDQKCYFLTKDLEYSFFYKECEGLMSLYNRMEKKDLYKLFEYYFIDRDINLNETEVLFNSLIPVFELFLEKNKNFFQIYLQNTASYSNRPLFYNCLNSMIDKLKIWFNSYIFPSLYVNNSIFIFCEKSGKDGYNSDIFNDNLFSYYNAKYKNYIDFSPLIIDIVNTKFHKDDNLNELFKERAINYIINNDSNLRLFIEEIYATIKCKILSKNGKFREKGLNINESFIIKIEKGKSISNSEFKELKMIEENRLKKGMNFNLKEIKIKPDIKKNKKIKLKLKTDKATTNTSVFYGVYKKNIFKRKNIPNSRYSGFIPSLPFSVGLSNSQIISQDFGNEFMLVNKSKNNFYISNKESNTKIFQSKMHIKNTESFVNVFDLIYTVKNIGKNQIIVNKNNISNALDNYSDPKMFIKLINYVFPHKNDEDVKIDFNMIKDFVDKCY